jgi:hypothetical protein
MARRSRSHFALALVAACLGLAAVGAVDHTHAHNVGPMGGGAALRGIPEGALSRASSLVSMMKGYPSLVEVADRIGAGSPAEQILELLKSIKSSLDAETADDANKQAGIQATCAKEVSDAQATVDQLKMEVASMEKLKSKTVVDSDVKSQELKQRDDAARVANQHLFDAKKKREESAGRLREIQQSLDFANEKHAPHVARLRHMQSIVDGMIGEISNAVSMAKAGGAAAEDTGKADGELEGAIASVGKSAEGDAKPAKQVMEAKAKADAEATDATAKAKADAAVAAAAAAKQATKADAASPAASSFLEVERSSRSATRAAAQARRAMMDVAEGASVMALARELMGSEKTQASGAVARRAALGEDPEWVSLVKTKLGTLKASFQGQAVRAGTVFNATQAAGEQKVKALKAAVAAADAEIVKLEHFLKTDARVAVQTTKAAIERLGASMADTKTQIDRSSARLKDATLTATEAADTCKTYAKQYEERKKAAADELKLINQLESMITVKLNAIRAILAKAEGQLAHAKAGPKL